MSGPKQQTLDICAKYRRAMSGGEPQAAVIGYLASEYDVQRPAIFKALRSGGVMPPYEPRSDYGRGRPRGGGVPGYSERRRERRRALSEIREERMSQPRVDRDPCQRCGVRHDVGCRHSRAPVGMML